MADEYQGMQQSSKNLVKTVDPEKAHSSLISDLRVATDKFFLNGQKDENFLPEIKDVIHSDEFITQ